jgi:WD40 repeat protein
LSAQGLTLRKVSFVSERVGWAIGRVADYDFSLVLRTTDGGETWRDVTPPPDGFDFWGDSFFLDEDHAWVAFYGRPGRPGPVWRTADGGVSWASSEDADPGGEAEEIEFIWFSDELHGWLRNRFAYGDTAGMAGGEENLYCTVDGGANWLLESSFSSARGGPQPTVPPTPCDFDTFLALFPGATYEAGGQAQFFDDLHGWKLVDGDNGVVVMRSSDGGQTWSQVLPSLAELNAPPWDVRLIGWHAGAVTDMDWSYASIPPYDAYDLLSVGTDGSVRGWDIHGTRGGVLAYESSPLYALAVSSASSKLAVGGRGGLFRVSYLDPYRGELRNELDLPRLHAGSVWSLDWDNNLHDESGFLASGGQDGVVRLWEIIDEGGLEQVLALRDEDEAAPVSALAWSDNLLAAGHDDGTIRVWLLSGQHPPTLNLIGEFKQSGNAGVSGLALEHHGTHLAASYYDGSVSIWDGQYAKLTWTWQDEGTWARSIAWSGGSSGETSLLAVGMGDGSIRILDAATGGICHRLEGHLGAVGSLKWSGGRYLISGGYDGSLREWRLLSRACSEP